MGKDAALIPVEDGTYDYAWVDPDDPRVREVRQVETVNHVGSLDGPTGAGENLVIHGDSGDALRSLTTIPELAGRYVGKVKLVYIDPPFNTNRTFDHYNDQLEHSIWLTMMRDRIRAMKPLLSPDASIWVHLDDAEVHRMRVLLDEEFGADSFAAEIVWQKSDTLRNDAQLFSVDHDIILVYRATTDWVANRMPRPEAMNRIYRSPDGDPVPWFDGGPTAPGARTHQGMVYAIQHPITGALMYPLKGRCWALGQSDILKQMREYAPYELRVLDDAAERAFVCGVEPDEVRGGVQAAALAVPLEEAATSATARYEAGNWPDFFLRGVGGIGGVGKKTHLPTGGVAPRTWWANSEVGSNRTSKKEIKDLFPDEVPFDTPKPERLLERIIHIASNPGDIVLDCFAGSGTTAAVAHKMGRRWVAVELSESTVNTFLVPRLVKVVNGDDPGGVTSRTERVAVADLPDGVTPVDAQWFTTLLGKFAAGSELPVDVVKALSAHIRAEAKSGSPTLSETESRTLLSLLRKLGRGHDAVTVDVMADAKRELGRSARTRTETTTQWSGGGGFTVARLGPSMYTVEDVTGAVFLSEAAVNGPWAKAVAGQLKFTLTPDHPVFCGMRRRQRLAVVDGVVDETVIRSVVAHLGDGERAVIVAKGVLPEAGALLSTLSPGSRLRKAPADLFPRATVR